MCSTTLSVVNCDKSKTVNEWLEAWGVAVKDNDFKGLLIMLHWGLQDIIPGADSDSFTRLVCHYLAVADGHGSPENFGHQGSLSSRSYSVSKSHGELMHELSDKAWMELCKRVFVFNQDDGGYGKQLKYSSYFRHPELAEAFVRFIDPDRWCEGGRYRLTQENIGRLSGDSAYHVKARAFVKAFLREAWQYREIVEREIQLYNDPQKHESARTDPKVVEGMKFFRKLKPHLARLMVHYDMVRFLYDQKLDHSTRQMLQSLTMNFRNDTELSLAEAYGHLNPKHGYLTVSSREVARILLLYPLLVRGRREYTREVVKARLAAKAAEADKLRSELEGIKARLEAVE